MKNQIKSFTRKAKTSPQATRLGGLSINKLNKIAQVLINIGDQLDKEDPALAIEADSLLKETLKQAQYLMHGGPKAMGCSDKCSGNYHAHDQDSFNIPAPSFSPREELNIEEITEPAPEYDEVGLDDIKSELENMKWHVADKYRRQALESAIEHIEKARDYHSACNSRKDKVHKIFDDAGLALRLKDFQK